MITKLLMASVFSIVPLLAMAAVASTELFLSADDVDLLVGTPIGVVEPLDSRRTVLLEKDRVDYSSMLDDDFSLNDSFSIQSWQDAEDLSIDESLIESQYLDLLSETNELEELSEETKNITKYFENTDTSSYNEIIEEQIETEQEL